MEQNYKKWLVVTADGSTQVIETYTKSAEVCNADGSLAKLLIPKYKDRLSEQKQKRVKKEKDD